MLSSNTTFDTAHALAYKTPMYLIAFSGETTDFCNHQPGSPTNSLKQYLGSISGTDQTVYPEDGRATISGVTFELLDYDNEITALLATDTYFFHRKKVTIEAGYLGMTEANMLTVFVGWVTGIKLSSDGLRYIFSVTDPKKWMQRKIFRGAEDSSVTLSGNPINILLAVLTSTGQPAIEAMTRANPCQVTWTAHGLKTGDKINFIEITQADWTALITVAGHTITWVDANNFTIAVDTSGYAAAYDASVDAGKLRNGKHDRLAAANGLGINTVYINVSNIEDVRDKWFPGNSHYMKFVIAERLKAIDWFENEIFRPLNIYPVIDGDGKFNIKPFKPPIAALDSVQSFTEDNIIGLPGWDMNLEGMFNEVEWHYNWDDVDEEFDNQTFYADSASINNRGPGKKPVTIKSKGLHTTISGCSLNLHTADVIIRRKNSIFNRFATPPLKITAKTFFDRWLSEAGDIVPLTHGDLPEPVAGTRGLTAERLEVIRRSVDWENGKVSIELLNTGFNKSDYGAISPTMIITAAVDGENFTVSAADAAKYGNYTTPEIQLLDSHGRVKVAAKTLLTVNTTTGACTCDDWGVTPVAGDIVVFANYDSCTTEQQLYSFTADAGNLLGAGNDAADLVVP